ncbi:hypothetical protein AOLI_G00275210 [Acnodon oligacanthus]
MQEICHGSMFVYFFFWIEKEEEEVFVWILELQPVPHFELQGKWRRGTAFFNRPQTSDRTHLLGVAMRTRRKPTQTRGGHANSTQTEPWPPGRGIEPRPS